jgi:hypothetical protein
VKDQSATLITVYILETLGVIRQLLTSLQNLVGVVQITDDQINTLRLKGRRILYHRVLEDVVIAEGRRLGRLACDLHELRATMQQWLSGIVFVSRDCLFFLQPLPGKKTH